MIHRAPFGSLERFLAILIEHTAGNFPLWLIPEQVKIIPVSEKFTEYSNKILNFLKITKFAHILMLDPKLSVKELEMLE